MQKRATQTTCHIWIWSYSSAFYTFFNPHPPFLLPYPPLSSILPILPHCSISPSVPHASSLIITHPSSLIPHSSPRAPHYSSFAISELLLLRPSEHSPSVIYCTRLLMYLWSHVTAGAGDDVTVLECGLSVLSSISGRSNFPHFRIHCMHEKI